MKNKKPAPKLRFSTNPYRRCVVFSLLFWSTVSLGYESGDPVEGKKLFVKQCSGCHSTDTTINHYAPNLNCIIGRKAGSADFSGYSGDFIDVTRELTWTEDLLFKYLLNQKDFIATELNSPDAQIMMNLQFPDPELRSNVIAYLKSICSEN